MNEYISSIITFCFVFCIICYFVQKLNKQKPKPRIDSYSGWNYDAPLCGNCQYWPLSGYYAARASEGGKPDGQGGSHCDGSMSDCRATLPGSYEKPGYGVYLHPQVKREHSCAHFKLRDWINVEINQ